MTRYLEVGLTAFIGLLAIYVVATAAAWQLQARLFPWVVAVPVAALAIAQICLTLRAKPSQYASDEAPAGQDIGAWTPQVAKEIALLVVWIVVFLICVYLFSIPWGMPLGVLLYLKFESKDRWPLALLLAGATWAYLFLIFDQGLHLPWPEGLISDPVADYIKSLNLSLPFLPR